VRGTTGRGHRIDRRDQGARLSGPHRHLQLTLFDVFDENDWAPTPVYTNPSEWFSDPRYSALVDAKQYLNSEGGSAVDYGCEMEKYGELKALIAGTTST
jgi:hypothetical protein